MTAAIPLPGSIALDEPESVWCNHERRTRPSHGEIEKAFRPFCPPEGVGTFESHPPHCTKWVKMGVSDRVEAQSLPRLMTGSVTGSEKSLNRRTPLVTQGFS